MKAQPTNLLDSLSNKEVTFFIPPYQRNYEWSTDTCKVFLNDVSRVAEKNELDTKTEHFFGSIVYVVEESGFGLPDRYVLTDGQQRITTTMLLLMALRDSIQDPLYKETIQNNYLQNERAGEGTEYKIKLKQVESDWEAYRLLALRMEVSGALMSSSVYRNYNFFKRQVSSMDDARKKSMLERGLNKFSIISIQLEPDKNPWENPQEIFESMNSLGQPLSLADLVRNYLLMKRSSQEQTELYNRYWLTLEKRLPGRLSEFIRDWLQANQNRSFKVATASNFKELYGSFKEVVGDRPVEDLFQDFVDFSQPYLLARGDQLTGSREIDQIISDLNVIGVTPAYSYLAQVISAWANGSLSNESLASVLTAIRTYLLRRRVLSVNAGENKFFASLGSRIDLLISADSTSDEIFRQLSSTDYALRLPNDEEVRAHLREVNFYNLGRLRNHPKLLLCMLEELLTRSRPTWDDEKLQLEHIMPQTLNAHWREELGGDFEAQHQKLVNNIGNITLIRHNQELGNKSFREKRILYAGQSGLQVTQNKVLDREVWGADSILGRRDYLVELLVGKVIQVPEKLKQGSNWSQGQAGSAQFDARQVLNQLIGQTISFLPNPTLTAVVVSDSKVVFDGQEWRLGSLTKTLKEREGKVGKRSVFHGPTYWSWEGVRLVDLGL
jgi:hypothetical protein